MALTTSVAFLVFGIAMVGYAWVHSQAGPEGLPAWSAGVGVALLPVLFVGSGAFFQEPSWRGTVLQAAVSASLVALTILAVRRLTTAKVAYKGLIMIAMPLMLLLVFAGLVSHVKRQSESAEVWAQHSSDVIGVSHTLPARLAEAQSAVRGYIITGDETFVGSSEKASATAAQAVGRMLDLVADNPPQQARIQAVAELTLQRMVYFRQTVALVAEGRKTDAEAIVKAGQGLALMTQISAMLAEFTGEEARLSGERHQALDASWQRLNWLPVSGTAAAILMSGILSLLFSGGISRRLRRVRTTPPAWPRARRWPPRCPATTRSRNSTRSFT